MSNDINGTASKVYGWNVIVNAFLLMTIVSAVFLILITNFYTITTFLCGVLFTLVSIVIDKVTEKTDKK